MTCPDRSRAVRPRLEGRFRRFALVLALLTAIGCVARDAAYSKSVAIQVTDAHFAAAIDVKFFEVASAGLLRDSVVVGLAYLGFASTAENLLVELLQSGRSGPLYVTVTGPVPSKSYAALLPALERLAGKNLERVELLWIGPVEGQQELLAAARAAGIQYAFKPFPRR